MEWWHWLVIGLILVALELAASGGFYVIFFGIAAIAVSALRLLNVAGPAWLQLLLFSAVAVGSLLVFRSRLQRLLRSPGEEVDSLVGETAVALETISPGAVGRVELRGALWSARNASTAPIEKGVRCTVVRTGGLMLFVKAEEGV